jgi:hypothetical protein
MQRYCLPIPTVPSGVNDLGGGYLVPNSRWRGSSGTAHGAPKNTSPRRKIRNVADKTVSVMESGDGSPFIFCRKSRLFGSHGAEDRIVFE